MHKDNINIHKLIWHHCLNTELIKAFDLHPSDCNKNLCNQNKQWLAWQCIPNNKLSLCDVIVSQNCLQGLRGVLNWNFFHKLRCHK